MNEVKVWGINEQSWWSKRGEQDGRSGREESRKVNSSKKHLLGSGGHSLEICSLQNKWLEWWMGTLSFEGVPDSGSELEGMSLKGVGIPKGEILELLMNHGRVWLWKMRLKSS